MNLTSNSIKQTLNNHLKNKMPNDIIKEFPTIRNLVLAYLKLVADEKGLTKIDKKDFIAQKYLSIKIYGLPLQKIEEKWLKYNSSIDSDYKTLADQLAKMKIFPQKTVNISVANKRRDINVIDTGKKYIPNDNIFITEEIINALNLLKEQENIEFMTNVFFDGHKALNLTDEDLSKIKKELLRRIDENTQEELKKIEEFTFDNLTKRTH